MMKHRSVSWLLGVTAAIELGAGLALLGFPAATAELLIGEVLESVAATAMARVGGAAICALGLACAYARSEGVAAKGLVIGMLFYNVVTATILAMAFFQAGLNGVLLWPGVILHAGMAGWCVMVLMGRGK